MTILRARRAGPGRRMPVLGAAFLIAIASLPLPGAAAPIVQPGPPGEPGRTLSADEAIAIARTGYSPADVRFLQDMIPHHQQAIDMANLVADRTNHPELVDVAGRIHASQGDEIAFMQEWLESRGEPVPEASAQHAMHTDHTMAGMASAEDMARLAESSGTEFDRLFLTLMIAHHEGALTMVEHLLEQPGAAYDPVLFEFTGDIVNDQTAEIERMNALLTRLSGDPRAGLSAGLTDAGEAIWNMRLVASLPRPPGFFDPDNPAERGSLPGEHGEESDEEAAEEAAEVAEAADDSPEEERPRSLQLDDERYPLLSFSNTDMAFQGDLLAVGNYHGVNLYRLPENGIPEHTASIVCPGGQGDVSLVGDLMIMSVEQTRGRVDCGLQGVTDEVSTERFRGIRIFDVSDPVQPRQVGAVQTCRGSHTHSVVSGPDEDGRIIVYNSGISGVRKEEELPGCFDELPGDDRTALFRVDVIEIPANDPAKARIVDSPAVFADPETGALAGLWRGGDHGDETQETGTTDHCHDITVFPDRGIAAGACSGNGILFDISNPLRPQRIHEVVDEGFAYWHSATFNNDGTKVLFTDEWGGGARPRCRASDPLTWGANAIYDIVDGKLEFRSHFKIPAPQTEQENCVAHNGAIVPVPGRDIFVQSWYQGGISVIDFTDSANPVEIAYFDRGPLDQEQLIMAGFWSSYWYRGLVYGTEIVRGLDVLALVPSEYLSQHELAAAALADQGERFNPQQQLPVSWPAEPVVALAYLDQLSRAEAAPGDWAAALTSALDSATARLDEGRRDRALAGTLDKLAKQALAGNDLQPARAGLAETLRGIATRLRG